MEKLILRTGISLSATISAYAIIALLRIFWFMIFPESDFFWLDAIPVGTFLILICSLYNLFSWCKYSKSKI